MSGDRLLRLEGCAEWRCNSVVGLLVAAFRAGYLYATFTMFGASCKPRLKLPFAFRDKFDVF